MQSWPALESANVARGAECCYTPRLITAAAAAAVVHIGPPWTPATPPLPAYPCPRTEVPTHLTPKYVLLSATQLARCSTATLSVFLCLRRC
jgi:hypothetical protein